MPFRVSSIGKWPSWFVSETIRSLGLGVIEARVAFPNTDVHWRDLSLLPAFSVIVKEICVDCEDQPSSARLCECLQMAKPTEAALDCNKFRQVKWNVVTSSDKAQPFLLGTRLGVTNNISSEMEHDASPIGNGQAGD